jgi:biofilm protein TabA
MVFRRTGLNIGLGGAKILYYYKHHEREEIKDYMMIYDSVENIEAYCEEGDAIYRAVQFVRDFDATQGDGKYEIEGDDIFAIIQSVRTSAAEEKVFEAHQDYVDVQMVLEGCERHDVVLLGSEDIEVVAEYDSEKDVMFFNGPEHFSSIIMKPGMFVVYGPGDGHRPCCSIGEPSDIRKVCVKIRIIES